MIYVLRNAPSNGAKELAKALGGMKVRALPTQKVTRRGTILRKGLVPSDVIVCWGSTVKGGPNKILNGSAPLRSKLTDVKILAEAKVPTIEVSGKPQPGYVGRMFDHTGGDDLLNPPRVPDFYVKQETFVKEFRVHSFMGRSLRSGIKQPREDVKTPHAWVRSWDGGWRISYDGESVRQRHRDVAHAAVKALGLDFGAVDIGQRKDKSLVVLEVNRAPGIEGGTIAAYAKAIGEWVKAGKVDQNAR